MARRFTSVLCVEVDPRFRKATGPAAATSATTSRWKASRATIKLGKLRWAGAKQPHQPTVMYVRFLDGGDSYCLGPFGSLLNLELNTLVFLE
jgi:hypothetical protein